MEIIKIPGDCPILESFKFVVNENRKVVDADSFVKMRPGRVVRIPTGNFNL